MPDAIRQEHDNARFS